jgi:hypothetical protein
MSEPMLHVLCARPGLIRGGVSHPSVQAHRMGAFTRAQLDEMLAEPAIAIVVGHRVMPEQLSDLLGVTEVDRTHLVGSRIDTDAGANANTEVLAQQRVAQDDVRRAEAAADAGIEGDVAAVETAAKTPRRAR